MTNAAGIYLDYLATTPVDPRVAEAMMDCLTPDGVFGNPASRSHAFGWAAEQRVEQARAEVAALIGAESRDIVFTSGATEADNLAIKGAAQEHAPGGGHIITSAIEHKAVLDSCAALEAQGYSVTYLSPQPDGRISPESVAAALRPDTVLVSVMHANNELGSISDIAAISEHTRQAGVLLHVDAAQSVGKIPVDVKQLGVDMLSMSAHKFYGPKGIGALYVRRRPRLALQAQIHGGGHERGLRSGTLPTHQIVGMGRAAQIALQELPAEAAQLTQLRDALWQGIADLPGVQRNGSVDHCLPGALNVAFAGIDGEALMSALRGLALSSGSACNSATVEPSFVLRGIGLSDALAHSSLRFSVGRFSSAEELDEAIARIRTAVLALQPPSK